MAALRPPMAALRLPVAALKLHGLNVEGVEGHEMGGWR